jgi:hypothetical protein
LVWDVVQLPDGVIEAPVEAVKQLLGPPCGAGQVRSSGNGDESDPVFVVGCDGIDDG